MSTTTREALAQITRAVERLMAAPGWLEGTPGTVADDTEAEAAMGQLRAAMVDAQAALAVEEPRMKYAHELAVGDTVAFDGARFDTISTLEELHRRGTHGLEWPEITLDVDMVWWLKGQKLRTDRTYVVRRPA